MSTRRLPRHDWLLRALTLSALSMLIKLNTKVASMDTRLAILEKTFELLAPSMPKNSVLIPRPASIYSATGFVIPSLFARGKHNAD